MMLLMLKCGGITGRFRANNRCKYSYNLGVVVNQTNKDKTGGITGSCLLESTTIMLCYNKNNVTSNGNNTGGIAGSTNSATIQDCYIIDSNSISVKYNNSPATKDIGVSNNYYGFIVGATTSSTIKNNNTNLTSSTALGKLTNMPSVYEVVNGHDNALDSGTSDIWEGHFDNNNVEIAEPTLKWESNIVI